MKNHKQPDPLDQKIDELLGSQSVQPSSDFTQRVLAAAEEIDRPTVAPLASRQKGSGFLIRFTLPLAAAIAVALTLVVIITQEKAPVATQVASLSQSSQAIEEETNGLEEIFLLEQGLSKLALTDADSSLESSNLLEILDTLDALYLEIES
ncbi:MAG: hypothetical protein AAGC73_09180 [Verrucomicrobiota bacterium]